MPNAYQSLSLREFEPDRLRDVVDGGQAEHLLLKPGSSGTQLVRWQSAELAIDRGLYGFDVLARGQFRPGFLALGCSNGVPGRRWANGFEVRNEQLQVYPEGSEILYRTDAGTSWTLIQVRRDELQRRALELLGRDLAVSERRVVNLQAPGEELTELARVVKSLLVDLERAHEPKEQERLRGALIDAVVDALASLSAPRDAERRALHAHVKTQTVLEAQRLLRARLGEPYDSATLCRAVDYPERTLELYFRQTVQMSPQSWHRKARMHLARKLLMEAEAKGRSISDVALRCGFDQLGRFSVEYRGLFGEKPSETSRRAGAAKARS